MALPRATNLMNMGLDCVQLDDQGVDVGDTPVVDKLRDGLAAGIGSGGTDYNRGSSGQSSAAGLALGSGNAVYRYSACRRNLLA